jgi:hypothetical protein
VEATEEGINADDADSPATTQIPRIDVPNTRRLCLACLRRLPVDGAAVSVRADASTSELLFATDRVSSRLDDLQFVLGEGPCLDAFRLRAAVLEPDLQSARATMRWPGFAREAIGAGAAAVFAFPLHIGAVPFGVLELYRVIPGGLAGIDLADAVVLADTGARQVLDDFADDLAGTAADPDPVVGQVEVPQATGMIAVQQGSTIPQALAALRAAAFAQNRPVIDVARDVVTGSIVFTPAPPTGPDG